MESRIESWVWRIVTKLNHDSSIHYNTLRILVLNSKLPPLTEILISVHLHTDSLEGCILPTVCVHMLLKHLSICMYWPNEKYSRLIKLLACMELVWSNWYTTTTTWCTWMLLIYSGTQSTRMHWDSPPLIFDVTLCHPSSIISKHRRPE